MSPSSQAAHAENRETASSRLEQVPAKRDAMSLRRRSVVSTNSLLFLEASALTAFLSGFRQGFSRDITPDRAALVDGGRIDPAQVARDIERGVRVVAVHHIQAQQLLFGFGERAVDHHPVP